MTLKQRLADAIASARQTEALVAQREAELDEAKRELLRLRREVLPDLMAEVGLSELDTADGYHVALRRDVSIKARGDEALDWLAQQDPTLVRTRLLLDMESPNEAVDLLLDYPDYNGVVERKIHPQTLGKWARERLAAGQPIPEELFDSQPFEYVTILKSRS